MKICAMLDFETLDTKPSSHLLSAGLTVFDLHQQTTLRKLAEQSLHLVFDERGQDLRTKSHDTIAWWKEQDEQAWELATHDNVTYPLQVGIFKLVEFLDKHNVEHIIGNGSTFDNMIFRHVCEQVNIPYPRPYWSDLDLRTMKIMADIKPIAFPSSLIKHYAKDDAIYEALCAQRYWKECNG